mgnify:CR=1 FL=1
MVLPIQGVFCMKNNRKSLLALFLSFFLVSCGSISSSLSEIENDQSSSFEEEKELLIQDISILPGEKANLIAKLGKEDVDAKFEILDLGKTNATVSEDGVLDAGIFAGTIKIKATYGKWEVTKDIEITTPIIDDSNINIPSSYKTSITVKTGNVDSLGNPINEIGLEFVKDKGFFLSLGEGGCIIENDKVYNYEVTKDGAKFNYGSDLEEEATIKDINDSFDLKNSITSSRYEFYFLNKESNEYIFQMNANTAASCVAEPTIFTFMGLFNMGINGVCVGVDAATGEYNDLYGVAGNKFYPLHLTSIDDLSVNPVGEYLSDGGVAEGGFEETF